MPRANSSVHSRSLEPKRSLLLGPTFEFLTALWELNHALEATSSRMQAELGVTAQQRMVIRIVGSSPGITAGQLAARLRIHPGTLSTALARLERRGLLCRKRDANDKRRVMLSLTKKGAQLDVPVGGTLESAIERVLTRVSQGDRAATLRCLTAMVSALEAAET